MSTTQSAEAVRAHGPAIAEQVRQAMYAADPFWTDRFGERGAKHAREDGDYHVRYLAEALEAGDPRQLAEYARWLRSVLATRGMCSLHLERNLMLLADAFDAAGVAGQEPAAYLREAASGLRYKGPGGALYESSAAVTRDVLAAFRDVPDANPVNPSDDELAHDAAHLVSYTTDAVALDRHDILAEHLRWADAFHVRHGRPRGYVTRLADAIERSLGSRDDADAVAALEHLRAARSELPPPAWR